MGPSFESTRHLLKLRLWINVARWIRTTILPVENKIVPCCGFEPPIFISRKYRSSDHSTLDRSTISTPTDDIVDYDMMLKYFVSRSWRNKVKKLQNRSLYYFYLKIFVWLMRLAKLSTTNDSLHETISFL